METVLALGSLLAPNPLGGPQRALGKPLPAGSGLPHPPHLPGQRVKLATGDARQRAKGWNGLTWSWRPQSRGRRCNWGRPRIGEEGTDFVWGKGWHSAAQGTRTLSRALTRLTRLISSSLFSCRALSKPNAFPPAGDKESAGKQGYLPDHAPPSEFPRMLRRAHRWRPRDVRRGTSQGHQALTLEPVAECDRHGMRSTPDKARDNREEKASGPDLRRRVATGPRGGGTLRPDTPRPAGGPPPAPLPAAARTRGIKAAV